VHRPRGGITSRVAFKDDITELRESLRPEHKTHAKAGTQCGGRWTPWRDTCERIARIVRDDPGIAFKDLLDRFGSFHYVSKGSARAALLTWIHAGKVDGVRIEREGRKVRLYPSSKEL
jgi:hypothetical protein